MSLVKASIAVQESSTRHAGSLLAMSEEISLSELTLLYAVLGFRLGRATELDAIQVPFVFDPHSFSCQEALARFYFDSSYTVPEIAALFGISTKKVTSTCMASRGRVRPRGRGCQNPNRVAVGRSVLLEIDEAFRQISLKFKAPWWRRLLSLLRRGVG